MRSVGGADPIGLGKTGDQGTDRQRHDAGGTGGQGCVHTPGREASGGTNLGLGLGPARISDPHPEPCLDLSLPASALPGAQTSRFSPAWISDPQPQPLLDVRPPASALPGSQTPNLSPAWISDSQPHPCLDLRPPPSALPGSQTPSLSPAWISDSQPQPAWISYSEPLALRGSNSQDRKSVV